MPLSGNSYILTVRVIAWLLLAVSLPALGLCREPQVPVFPKSDVASLAAMEAAQDAMQRYIKMTEDYLDCLAPAERKQKMDGILVKMKQVTSDYNALMVAYRKRKADQLFSETPR